MLLKVGVRGVAGKQERTAAVMAIQERVKPQLAEADLLQSLASMSEDDSDAEGLSVGTSEAAYSSMLSQFGRAFKVPTTFLGPMKGCEREGSFFCSPWSNQRSGCLKSFIEVLIGFRNLNCFTAELCKLW